MTAAIDENVTVTASAETPLRRFVADFFASRLATVGLTSLLVTYPTFLVPFCTWLLMGYFRTIPREVEECALVDGTRWRCAAHRRSQHDSQRNGRARRGSSPAHRGGDAGFTRR